MLKLKSNSMQLAMMTASLSLSPSLPNLVHKIMQLRGSCMVGES